MMTCHDFGGTDCDRQYGHPGEHLPFHSPDSQAVRLPTVEQLAAAMLIAQDGNGRRTHANLTLATARTDAAAILAALAAAEEKWTWGDAARAALKEQP